MSVATTSTTMTGKGHIVMHQVRMEILVQPEKKGINICDLLSNLMKLANSGQNLVDFKDADKLPIDPAHMPSEGSFKNRLRVTSVQTNKLKKVTLGFYMASSSSFAEIKNSIGLGWLRRYHVFLRQQHLPFEHGTDLYLMGYIVQEHPSFASIGRLERKLALSWYDSDDRERIDSSSNTDLKKVIEAMEKDKFIAHDRINFPVTLEKGFIRVSAEGRTQFDTQVLYVYVPRQFRVPATVLSDRAILEKEDHLTMIPFSLSKADP
jgi:hypothetical protein